MRFTRAVAWFFLCALVLPLHLACAGADESARVAPKPSEKRALQTVTEAPGTRSVQALVIYACDSNDHYPLPSRGFRDSLYARITDFYKTMSYGKHRLSFREANHDDVFFVSQHDAGYYNSHYDKRRHVRGFGMFNEEILQQVLVANGEELFDNVDILIMVGTDGGPGWYAPGVNATGFGMLGVDFKTANRTFGRWQRQGGFTLEIGSDFGTSSPDDDVYLTPQEIQWTIAHEYAHWLGLGHRGNNLGIYSLMSRQLFGNDRMPQFGPPPLDIFHIMDLGWLDRQDSSRVIKVRHSGKVMLNQVRAKSGPVVAQVDWGQPRAGIYITYHRQASNPFDGSYVGEGLLVWDKRRGRVDLRTPSLDGATGLDHLDRGLDRGGRAADFLQKTSGRFTVFSESAVRATRANSRPRIVLSDVQLQGEQATFQVEFGN